MPAGYILIREAMSIIGQTVIDCLESNKEHLFLTILPDYKFDLEIAKAPMKEAFFEERLIIYRIILQDLRERYGIQYKSFVLDHHGSQYRHRFLSVDPSAVDNMGQNELGITSAGEVITPEGVVTEGQVHVNETDLNKAIEQFVSGKHIESEIKTTSSKNKGGRKENPKAADFWGALIAKIVSGEIKPKTDVIADIVRKMQDWAAENQDIYMPDTVRQHVERAMSHVPRKPNPGSSKE